MFLNGKLEEAANKSQIELELHRVDYSARMYKHKYVTEHPYIKMDHQFLRQFIAVHAQDEDKEQRTNRVIMKMCLPQIKRMTCSIYPCDEFVFGKDSGEGNTLIHYLAQN